MNSTPRLLLTVGLCSLLGGVLLIRQTRVRALAPTPTRPLAPVRPSKPTQGLPLKPTRGQDAQARFRNTATHRQVSRACAMVTRAVDVSNEGVTTHDQRFAIRTHLAIAQKLLVPSQKSLEQQLTQKIPQQQRAFLRNDLADVDFALAQILVGKDKEKQALPLYQRAYETHKSSHPLNAAQDLFCMGWAYFRLARYREAVDCHRRAIPVFHSRGASEREIHALHSLAYACQFMQRYADALQALQRSLPLARKIKNEKWELRELNFFADIYSSVGYNKEALKSYQLVRSLQHNRKDGGGEAWALRNLAGLYNESGDSEKALQHLNEAVSIYRKLKTTIEEEMSPEFGDVYMQMGRYKDAQRLYEAALARARRGRDDKQAAGFLSAIGDVKLKQQRFQEALALFKRALPVKEKADHRLAIIHILTGMTTAYANLNQPQQAIAYGKQAINLMQAVRRDNEKLDPKLQRALLAGHRGLYERVAALLAKQNRQEEAEQMLRFLRQEDVFSFVQQEPTLAKDLAGLFDPLVFTPAEKKHLSPEVAKQVSVGRGCHESRLWQRALLQQEKAGREHVALISTFNTEDTFYLLLTTAKQRRIFHYPVKKKDFDALSVRLQKQLSDTDKDPQPDALKMYRIVFSNGQLEQALKQAGITTAMWFTSGSLRSIPIDALYDGKEYLIWKPCANVAATLTSYKLFTATTHGPALAAGMSTQQTVAPDLPGEKSITLPALTKASEEVRNIVRDSADGGQGPFPGKILLDGKCTAANIKRNLARHPSIVHFATHFMGSSNGSQEPYFLMADGKRLSLSQWKQTLRLQGVGLLTLSACNTGVGTPDTSGGDVSSIGELSQYLGAQSVVASLWLIDDEATSHLMPDFYARWHKAPQAGKAQALRAAQRALMRQGSTTASAQGKRGIKKEGAVKSPTNYAHPYYWAPFSLTGNWK